MTNEDILSQFTDGDLKNIMQELIGGCVKTPNINKKTRCTFLCGCTTSFCFSTKKSLINNLYGVI